MTDGADEDEPRPVPTSRIVAQGVSITGHVLTILAIGFAVRIAAVALEPFAGEATLFSFDVSLGLFIAASLTVPGLVVTVKTLGRTNDHLRGKLRRYREEVWHLEKRIRELEGELQGSEDDRPIDEIDSDGHDDGPEGDST